MYCPSRLKILDHCIQIYFFLILCSSNFKPLNSFDQPVSIWNGSNQSTTPSAFSGSSNNQSPAPNRTRIRIENCYSVVSKFENLVNFLGLNLSFYEFQQIINLKPGGVAYFGKKIAMEGNRLTLTCIQRPTAPLVGRAEWRLNAELIEQHYSARNHQKSKKSSSKFYQTEQWFCRNLNLAVNKLTIKKVEFSNQGEYECTDRNDADKSKESLFVQVLITDWEDFNVNFLSQVYYDILTRDSTLVKYCPLSSASWYRWGNKLLASSPTIAISEPGLYHCHSEMLNRRINFYVFGKACLPVVNVELISGQHYNNHAFFFSESPTIRHFSVSGSVSVGGQLKFECNASAYPLAELQWYFGKWELCSVIFDNVCAHCVRTAHKNEFEHSGYEL